MTPSVPHSPAPLFLPVLLLSLAFTPRAAMAQEAPLVPSAQAPSQPTVSIREEDQSGIFAARLPLSVAMGLLLPKGIQVYYGSNVNQSLLVNITPTASWRKGINQILGQARLEAELQGRILRVFACNLDTRCGRGILFETVSGVGVRTSKGGGEQDIESLFSDPSHFAARRWVASQGDYVEDVLQGWASVTEGGWSVVYEAKHDYLLSSGAVFQGTFVEAVNGFVSALSTNTRLKAEIYVGNKAVVLRDG